MKAHRSIKKCKLIIVHVCEDESLRLTTSADSKITYLQYDGSTVDVEEGCRQVYMISFHNNFYRVEEINSGETHVESSLEATPSSQNENFPNGINDIISILPRDGKLHNSQQHLVSNRSCKDKYD